MPRARSTRHHLAGHCCSKATSPLPTSGWRIRRPLRRPVCETRTMHCNRDNDCVFLTDIHTIYWSHIFNNSRVACKKNKIYEWNRRKRHRGGHRSPQSNRSPTDLITRYPLKATGPQRTSSQDFPPKVSRMLSKVRFVLRSYFGSDLVLALVIRLIPSVLLSTVCGLNVGDSDTDRCRTSLVWTPELPSLALAGPGNKQRPCRCAGKSVVYV